METIWFILWGILWAGYFVLDGYDLGIGTLLPFLGNDEKSRRVMINAMGPFWDGNEVWLITAGGATFAAFPRAYAVMFSALYTPLMLILFALIIRGVSFEFRNKIDDPRWRRLWDTCLTVGSLLPALLFGVAFANLFQGIPIDAEGVFQGTVLSLLNPYGLLGGILFVLLFLVHGSFWLAHMTEGELHDRSVSTGKFLWPLLAGVAAIFLGATAYYTPLYRNLLESPMLFAFPLMAASGLILTRAFLEKGRVGWGWWSSAAAIAGTVFFGVSGLFPNLIPSSLNPSYSLTAFNSASSPLTLKIMFIVAIVLMPLVIAYQSWVHLRFGKKIRFEDLHDEESY